MTLPSVKTLTAIAGNRAKELRKILEATTYRELESILATGRYPATQAEMRYCHHFNLTQIKLSIASEITGQHGVEYIPCGRNANSPAIHYVNTGDPYRPSLMYVGGRGYRVACWGDLVERGNYS